MGLAGCISRTLVSDLESSRLLPSGKAEWGECVTNDPLVDCTENTTCTRLLDAADNLALRLIALHQLVRFNNLRPRIDLFDHQLELASFYQW